MRSGDGCGQATWRVYRSVWEVVIEWRVSSSDPHMFHFLYFYSSLDSQVFSRRQITMNKFFFFPPTYSPSLLTVPLTVVEVSTISNHPCCHLGEFLIQYIHAPHFTSEICFPVALLPIPLFPLLVFTL